MKPSGIKTKKKKNLKYTFFSSAHGTFSRIEHILQHKTNVNKFKSTKIIASIFSEHNGMKPEINHRKRNEKKLTTWRLNSMLLKNQSTRKSKRKCEGDGIKMGEQKDWRSTSLLKTTKFTTKD